MIGSTTFETFMRAAFGMEPGGRAGNQLNNLCESLSLARGAIAGLDRRIDKIVYICSGATKLCAQGSGARAQIIAFHFGGDIISIPADAAHRNSLTALLATDLLIFPAREFFDCACTENAMARTLLDRLPLALHRCRDKTVALGCKNAGERIASFLCAMALRIGRLHGNSGTLDLPMSRRDIGESLGLTIETVSRQLGALKDAGLIKTIGRSQIRLNDLDALGCRAGNAMDTRRVSDSSAKFDLGQRAGQSAPISF